MCKSYLLMLIFLKCRGKKKHVYGFQLCVLGQGSKLPLIFFFLPLFINSGPACNIKNKGQLCPQGTWILVMDTSRGEGVRSFFLIKRGSLLAPGVWRLRQQGTEPVSFIFTSYYILGHADRNNQWWHQIVRTRYIICTTVLSFLKGKMK